MQGSSGNGLGDAALAVLDASIVVIDSTGRIVLANDAWRTLGFRNGSSVAEWTDRNYLDECIRAAGEGVEDAAVVLAALRQVLSGTVAGRRYVYDCSSPDDQRYYGVTINGFEHLGARYAAVVHENVTDRLRGDG